MAVGHCGDGCDCDTWHGGGGGGGGSWEGEDASDTCCSCSEASCPYAQVNTQTPSLSPLKSD